jgi:hypothetical protein
MDARSSATLHKWRRRNLIDGSISFEGSENDPSSCGKKISEMVALLITQTFGKWSKGFPTSLLHYFSIIRDHKTVPRIDSPIEWNATIGIL